MEICCSLLLLACMFCLLAQFFVQGMAIVSRDRERLVMCLLARSYSEILCADKTEGNFKQMRGEYELRATVRNNVYEPRLHNVRVEVWKERCMFTLTTGFFT